MSNEPLDPSPESVESDAPVVSRFGMGRVRLAFTRWWIMLIFAIVGYVVALYFLSVLQPSHEATGVLEIVTKKQKLVGADLEQEQLGLEGKIITLANKMLSPTQLKRVASNPKVQALEKAIPPAPNWKPRFWRQENEGVYKPAASVSPGELGHKIIGWSRVIPRAGTTLIDVRVVHPDDESAIVIANAILTEYIAAEADRKTGGASEAFKILRVEAAEAATEMESAEQALQGYKVALKVSSDLSEKRGELATMRLKYLPKHPKMIETTALYNTLSAQFEREMDTVFRSENEQDYWASRKQNLDGLLRSQAEKTAVSGAPQAPVNMDHSKEAWAALAQNYLSARASFLRARLTNQQKRYQSVTSRISEIDVVDDGLGDDLRISEPAFSTGAVKSQRLEMLSQGLGFGALVGFAIAYLLGVIDYKIYDVRSVEEATQFACLAAVPISDAFEDQEDWAPVLLREPSSANSESIRNLRASVILLGKKARHQSIVLTSPAPGEGKTTIACELAASFALAHQRTCIIDLDLRKPRVHQLFPGIKDQLGSADVLAGQAELKDVIRTTKVDGLFVIGSGSKAASPAELLQKSELTGLIESLCKQFDRVIIDTPPVLPVSDTRLLGQIAHSVIVVIRAQKTPVGALMRAIQLLKESNARIVGTTLNALPKRHQGARYYGYKGYGEYGAHGGYKYYDDEK